MRPDCDYIVVTELLCARCVLVSMPESGEQGRFWSLDVTRRLVEMGCHRGAKALQTERCCLEMFDPDLDPGNSIVEIEKQNREVPR
jgi:hypothetical protein